MFRRSRGSTPLRTISEDHSQPHNSRKSSEDTIVERPLSEVTLVGGATMETTDVNRKRSFGIGGAGNIRRRLPAFSLLTEI